MVRFLLSIVSLTFISCGKQSFPDYSHNSFDDLPEYQQGEKVFRGTFSSLNSSRIKAQSLFWTRGDQFYASVTVNNGGRKLRLQQYIHAGERCPDASDDRDGNGVIDLSEVIESSGEMLIPLDRSLRAQEAGRGWFPQTNSKGTYFYSRSTALRWLIDDLYQPDLDKADGLGKLPFGERLNLDQKTVILYGTFSDPLKPVACAEITEDENFTGQ